MKISKIGFAGVQVMCKRWMGTMSFALRMQTDYELYGRIIRPPTLAKIQ